MEAWATWLIISVLLAILEILTATFMLIWFSIGALAASIATNFTNDPVILGIVFLVVSAIGLTQSKKLYRKFTSKITYKSNVEAVVGKTGVVTSEIIPKISVGRVKVDGESWSANSDEKLIEGDIVNVKSVDGVKLIVEKQK